MTPPFVDAEHIRRQADERRVRARCRLLPRRRGAQRDLGSRPPRVVESVVDGSGRSAYRCRIRLDPARPERPIVSTSCTCPMQPDCKHTVATLLAATGSRGGGAAGRSRRIVARRCSRRRREPTRRGPRRRSRSGSSCASACGAAPPRWAPVRVESASPRGLHQFGIGCARRACARWSAAPRTDAWIKGAVSWDALRRPGHAYEPAQARWFTELLQHRAATCACSDPSRTRPSG